MNPQGTILGCFVLFILVVIVTLSWDPLNAFLMSYKRYDIEGEDFLWVKYPKLENICLLVSILFLLLTFVVYSILPEFQNMHGYTLRAHVASLFVTNVIDFCIDEFPIILSTRSSCLSMAYILNFSSLSSIFWLNVIFFDTWWTLRQIRSYRTNLRKREKKLFIMYSIYAWGISFILNVVYDILDIPGISKHLSTPPEMCVEQFSFSLKGLIYFFVPVSVSISVNICFFIAITLKIWNHGKQTDNQLRNSRTSHDNKNKFTIYMTLSAVLGLGWIMKIISWMTDRFVYFYRNDTSLWKIVLWHIAAVTDTFQGVILFFAFVGKKKIMLLLLKRIGWQDSDSDNISRNNNRPSTYSSTVTLLSISPIVSMQEISLSNQQINHRVESYF